MFDSDPNPGRAIPLGGRSYPAGAAGTRLPSGLILSGDDAPAFERAGFDVIPMHVQCSAKIAAGEQRVDHDAQYVVAIDCNGAGVFGVITAASLRDYRAATGIYNGAELPSVAGYLYGRDIIAAHTTLLRELPGFACFAVMTAR